MVTYSVPQMQGLADYYSGLYGVPPSITRAVVGAESSWNPLARNPGSTATGLGQVLASTARQPGYGVRPLADRTDPAQSLDFVAQYLSALKNTFGTWTAALQRYSGQAGTPYAGNPDVQQALASVGETGLGTTGAYTPVSGFIPVSARGRSLGDFLRDMWRMGNPTPEDFQDVDRYAQEQGRDIGSLLARYGINSTVVLVGVIMIALGAYFLVKRGF